MKKISDKWLRRLISSGLALVLALSPVIVFAAEGDPEELTDEVAAVAEPAPEVTEPEEPEEPEAVEPEAAEPAAEETAEPAAEETAEPVVVEEEPVAAVDEVADAPAADAEEPETEEVSEIPDAQAQPAEGGAAVTAEAPALTVTAAGSEEAATITIGDASFSADADESSHWSGGKGWKNIGGKYVAMVDYDGRDATVSADGGTLTLAVAGINRIGTLAGDCNIQIVGTGIVLIDSIAIEEGNGITLHPNTALYEEGSAAVFLKQEDGSYKLINGSVIGILDEEYSLKNVKLTIPRNSTLRLNAAFVNNDYYGARVIIGNDSTLTVDTGGTVELMTVEDGWNNLIDAELIVQGVLSVNGTVQGGYIDIQSGGNVTGTTHIKSSTVHLQPNGNLSNKVRLTDSSVYVYKNPDNSARTVNLSVYNSNIFLIGSGIAIDSLTAAGSSTLSIDTNGAYSRVGDITFVGSGGTLDIVHNDHPYVHSGELWESFPERLLEDCRLEINGKITGGQVRVLAGCVNYTGTNPVVLPTVPEDSAARVLINGTDTTASLAPLRMTREQADDLATKDKIPVYGYMIYDRYIDDSGAITPRKWYVDSYGEDYDPLSRSAFKETTTRDILSHYHFIDEDG